MSGFSEAKTLAIALAPNLGSRLAAMHIVLDQEIETAATDCKKIYVNPEFWDELNNHDRAFVLLHEAAHCVLGHLKRMWELRDELYNLAADVIVNELIARLSGIQLLEGYATRALLKIPGHLTTTEEIYNYLRDSEIRPVLLLDDIHPLHPPVVGNEPGEEMVREYLEGQSTIPWPIVLRRYMMHSLKSQYQSWTRFNRRFGLKAPGYVVTLRNAKLFVAVDTSLSIDEKTLGRFLAEARTIASLTGSRGYLVFWSHGVDSIHPLRTGIKYEAKSSQSTVFVPVAREIAKRARGSRALCVVLTDGFWSDSDAAVKEMKGAKWVSWIIATTHRKIQGFQNVEVKP